MYTLGVDIGSTTCKALILKDGCDIVAMTVANAGTGTSGPRRALADVFSRAGLDSSVITRTVVTGYGRMTFSGADNQVSELSCHCRGVSLLRPETRTLIDIGGQDAKAMRLTNKGTMSDFIMNDKCAAGTGRFLDVMAGVLEVSISDLQSMDERAQQAVSISNVCTVFAESEVISRLAGGVDKNDIVAGIHLSVARRVAGLVKRIGVVPPVVMTGGVAQNEGVVRAMSEVLEVPVQPAPMAQLTGALGAAIFAYSEQNKR